jgi:hypothetical protein
VERFSGLGLGLGLGLTVLAGFAASDPVVTSFSLAGLWLLFLLFLSWKDFRGWGWG